MRAVRLFTSNHASPRAAESMHGESQRKQQPTPLITESTMTHTRARVAIFNDTRRTSHYGCEIVMQVLEEQLRSRNMTIAFSWPMGRDWRDGIRNFNVFNGIDAVIVNGEGSIHHSDTRDRAHYLTEIARFFFRKVRDSLFPDQRDAVRNRG